MLGPVMRVEHDPLNDIYTFKFYEASRQAVDTYAATIREIITTRRSDDTLDCCLRLVLDFARVGVLPLGYFVETMHKVGKDLAPVPPAFVAYILDDVGDHSVLEAIGFSRKMRQEDLRAAFSHEEHDAMIAWLLDQCSHKT